jgi:hypothetical protein
MAGFHILEASMRLQRSGTDATCRRCGKRRRVGTVIFVPVESGSVSAVEAQELDLNHGA